MERGWSRMEWDEIARSRREENGGRRRRGKGKGKENEGWNGMG
jgi:hypothetical protein